MSRFVQSWNKNLIYKKIGRIDLPASSSNFLSIHRFDGDGFLDEIYAQFNNDDVEVEVLIDGNKIFELNLETSRNLLELDVTLFGVSLADGGKKLNFKPRLPIKFKESLEFKARANDNSTTRDLLSALVIYSGVASGN